MDGRRGVSGESEKGLGPNSTRAGRLRSWGAQHILLALQADVQFAIGMPEAALASVAS